jgi:hypothetical protein
VQTGLGIAVNNGAAALTHPAVQYVNPTTAGGNQFAEQLQLYQYSNLNIAATAVLNADNIQVGGIPDGVPVAQAHNLGAPTSASNITGVATRSAEMRMVQATMRGILRSSSSRCLVTAAQTTVVVPRTTKNRIRSGIE